jgi:hypothetical protein
MQKRQGETSLASPSFLCFSPLTPDTAAWNGIGFAEACYGWEHAAVADVGSTDEANETHHFGASAQGR